MQDNITFELTRGYLDSEGRRHRKVVLRAPTADDEIRADQAMNLLKASRHAEERAEGHSDTLWTLTLIARCAVQLGEIRKVTTEHLRTLSRRDSLLMQTKMAELEASLDEAIASGPNPASGASTSSDSLEQPALESASS